MWKSERGGKEAWTFICHLPGTHPLLMPFLGNEFWIESALGSCVVMEQQRLSADEVGQVEGQPASLGVWCMVQLPPAPLELPSHTSVFKEKDSSVVKIGLMVWFHPGVTVSLCILSYSDINVNKTDLWKRNCAASLCFILIECIYYFYCPLLQWSFFPNLRATKLTVKERFDSTQSPLALP